MDKDAELAQAQTLNSFDHGEGGWDGIWAAKKGPVYFDLYLRLKLLENKLLSAYILYTFTLS